MTVATPPAMVPSRWVMSLHDGLVITKRNLLHTTRVPELLLFTTLQPVMFVLLFAYVFGGAIPIPGGGSYREFLMAGIFVQTIAFNGASTAVGMAEDMQKGLVDRFRSLPMAHSAVLVGRTIADMLRGVLVLVVMSICGFLVGWRIHNGVAEALFAYALILAFGFAMSWIGAWIGLKSPNTEVANSAGFIWLFPMTFLSNAFVPLTGMPTVLQTIAVWNPVSAVVAASRDLFGNPNPYVGDAWPEQYPILVSIVWIVAILAIFVPLSVRAYRRSTSR
ncbi:MAG TPA: ABC transporter permease [Actinomycetes bacterium]|nr:ABC transporter permease [Actinomycetes bacterium]